MAYHVVKRNRNNVIVKKTKNRTSTGWTQVAKGINRASRTRKELEKVLSLPAFAPFKNKIRGMAYERYGLSGIIEEDNGSLKSFKSPRKVTAYQTQSQRNKWKKWFNGVMSGKIKPTDDRYVAGLLDKQGLQNKHLNLQEFRSGSPKQSKMRISAKRRIQFGLSATMYDSDTLASRDYNMDFDQVSKLGKELREKQYKSLAEWKAAGHTSKGEIEFYNTIVNNKGKWERDRDRIRKEREQEQLLG